MNSVVIYTDVEKKLTLFTKYSTIVSEVVNTSTTQKYLNFIQKENYIFKSIDGETKLLEPNKIYKDEDFKFYLQKQVEKKCYSIEGITLITIENSKFATIGIKDFDGKISIENNDESIILHPGNNVVYVNNTVVKECTIIQYGDVVDIIGCEFTFRAHTLEIIDGLDLMHNNKLLKVVEEVGLKGQNAQYKRSPRIVHNEPDEDISISNPPSESKPESGGVIRLIIPPLLTMSITVAMGILLKRGPYMYMMMATSGLAIIMSVVNYFRQKKERKLKNENRVIVYRKYLRKKMQDISLAVNEQSQSLNYHYPTSEEILNMVKNTSSRLYEKNSLHHDFLQVRIGQSFLDLSFKVKFDEKDFTEEEDFLVDEAREIKNRFTKQHLLPRTIHLQHGAVGLVGNRNILIEQTALILNQLAYFHSYHDLEIVHVFAEEELEFWSAYDFLPHINSKSMHVRTNIYSEKTRDQILSSLYQVFKTREQSFSEKKDGGGNLEFSQNIVLIISDMKQIVDHSIMEFLSKDVTHLGVNVIYTDRSMKNLPEHVVTVVEYKNQREARIINEENEYKQEKLFLDHVKNFDYEIIPRVLSGYEHVLTLQSSIPEKVGFLEMYNVEFTNELNINNRWNVGEPGKTLAVPLGYRAPDDIVYLNLHEKAHGPHGLVAGTTGSGKSEIVQSYILSLAVNFHPYDVGFLLIDYKGGGMANLFKDLPHLLGTITNLDGAASMRALISIKAELLRRQQLFSENDVNHVDGYQKLFKEGKVSEPMPHLFMISDEFAELKSEQPEFMKELVSTARIGRSLGIHLILATQKPSGVVDDQIWSNSKFKLCLKVQNEADSNEMLKTKDAASITQPGRSYLQVGNNEIYELFQSAYSGAPYMGGVEIEDVRDNRIYEINKLGQYQLMTQDLSKGNLEITKDELTAVVEEVATTFNALNIEKVASPWLEPLKEQIQLEELKVETNNIEVVLGLSDEPSKQAQNPLVLDLNTGHLGIFGLSGFGKTTLIQTMIKTLATNNTPEQLHMYLIDFGGGLLSFRDLPHVADIVTLDEEEKLGKLFRILYQIVAERKAKFKQAGVADIETYIDVTNDNIPRIILFLDNYDAARDLVHYEVIDSSFNKLTREGINLGIHIVIGASKLGAIKYNILSNIKHKTSFFVIDKSDINQTVGRTQLEIEEVVGRAIIKMEEPLIYQAALPIEGEDNKTRLKNLREYSLNQNKGWTGNKPQNIPMLPEEITGEYFMSLDSVKDVKMVQNTMSVGLDIETAQSLNFSNNLVIIGNARKAVPIYESILRTTYPDALVTILDSKDKALKEQSEKYKVTNYISNQENLFSDSKDIIKGLIDRQEQKNNKKCEEHIIIIADMEEFCTNLVEEGRNQIARLYENLKDINATFILGYSENNYGKGKDTLSDVIKSTSTKVVLGKVGEIHNLDVNGNTYREPDITVGEANYVLNREFKKFKIINE